MFIHFLFSTHYTPMMMCYCFSFMLPSHFLNLFRLSFVFHSKLAGDWWCNDYILLYTLSNSLEVIPGDAYEVQRSGDDVAGYVTTVVYKSKSNHPSTSSSSSSSSSGDDDNGKKGPSPPPAASAAGSTTVDDGDGPRDDKKEEEGKKVNNEGNNKKKNEERKRRKKADDDDDGGGEKTIPAAAAGAGDAAGDAPPPPTTTTTKKERRRLKREARKLLAREEGRSKRRKTESSSSSSSSSSSIPPSSAGARDDDGASTTERDVVPREDVDRLRTAWSIAAPGAYLHPALCAGLHVMGYSSPTPIQSATLPPAMMGRRDIVGAAPTGSGKTLSYGLPILQRLLEERDEEEGEGGGEERGGATRDEGARPSSRRVLRALILTPTRELAMQVSSELSRACRGSVGIGTIVGGFAEAKQRRVLERDVPPVVVATPGRLWELVSPKEKPVSLFFFGGGSGGGWTHR